MNGFSQVDLADAHGVRHEHIRKLLKEELGSRPHRKRLQRWMDDGAVKMPIARTNKGTTRQSFVIPIVKELVTNPSKTFADIARGLGISRERVGQVADLCASINWDVSRGRCIRGTVKQ